MAVENHTTVYKFIFVGFTDSSKLQIPLFIFFLVVYLITLNGNLGMVFLIRMLMDLVVRRKTISLIGCALQMWFFGLFLATECFLLASMAYDRYVAIANPLLYTMIMSQNFCAGLVIIPYLFGVVNAATHTTLSFQLIFCHSNIINHFFYTQLNNMVLLGLSCTFGVLSTSIIIISYTYVLAAILRIRSKEGRRKAFSTHSTHLTVVSIFYRALSVIYVRPSSSSLVGEDKLVSMFYTVIIPMLNPLIYSLRNKEVKDALKKLTGRTAQHCASFKNKRC
uniref:G-protein coupled receptors family 1 profile domain-containing protein n=1 Tax=Varanus komodoensis TaxID=61221 RepID=A0A8D2LHW3_VARKO